MKNIKTLITLSFLLLSVQCLIAQEKDKEAIRAYRDAEKAYKKKNYQSSLILLSSALNGTLKKKQQEEAEEILPIAFNEFFTNQKVHVASLEKNSEQYNGLTTVRVKKQIVESYMLLHSTLESVRKIPEAILSKCKILEQTKEDFHAKHTKAVDEYNSTVDTYVEEQYNLGVEALSKKTKPEAQIAYRFFFEANSYKSGYKDIAQKMEEAKILGTYRVAIGSFENMSGVASNDRLKGILSYELNSALKMAFKPDNDLFFIEVIPVDATASISFQKIMLDETKLQTFAKDTKADLIIFGSIKSSNITISETTTKTYERERNVVVGQTTKIVDGKSKKVDVYDNVKATFYTYNQSKQSRVSANLYIYNALAKRYINREDAIEGSDYDPSEWYKYSGNVKALYDEEQRKIKESIRTFRSDEEMITRATQALAYAIQSKLSESLKSINIVK